MRVIVESAGREREFLLREGTTRIGRDPSCYIRLADPSLSRQHLECTLRGGELVVRDLNSKNGTYLGSQRIQEAHIQPGVRLRIGRLWLLFDETLSLAETRPVAVPPADTAASIQTAPSGAAPGPEEPELEVPLAENYEEDEEPTPVDESVAQSVAAGGGGGGTRLMVRGDRWFVQDTVSGAEVEIVPRLGAGPGAAPASPGIGPTPKTPEIPTSREQMDLSQAGLPAPQAGLPVHVPRNGAVTAGAPRRRPAIAFPQALGLRNLLADPRRRRIVLAATGAFVLLALLGAFLLRPEKKPEPLTSAQYRALVDEAVGAFRNGRHAEAATRLQDLRKQPVQSRQHLAGILLDAFESDEVAQENFRGSWQGAKDSWEEVRNSPESIDSTRDLADAQLQWIISEVENMVRLDEARDSLKQGKLAECLDRAFKVNEDSLFWKEAEPLITRTVEAVMGEAEAKAAQAEAARDWPEGIRQLQVIEKYRSGRSDEIASKIAAFRKWEDDKEALQRTRTLTAEAKYSEAIQHLNSIATDSPYAGEAAAVKADCNNRDALQRATAVYSRGNGKEALDILAGVGLEDSDAYRKIRAVLTHREKADQAFEAADFDAAKKELEDILNLESVKTNQYARDAERELNNVDQTRTKIAQKLMDEADAAIRARNFVLARSNYEKVLRLDPASMRAALSELEKLRKAAEEDYNLAMILKREEPQRALKLLHDAMDRVSRANKLYQLAQMQMHRIKADLGEPDAEEPE